LLVNLWAWRLVQARPEVRSESFPPNGHSRLVVNISFLFPTVLPSDDGRKELPPPLPDFFAPLSRSSLFPLQSTTRGIFTAACHPTASPIASLRFRSGITRSDGRDLVLAPLPPRTIPPTNVCPPHFFLPSGAFPCLPQKCGAFSLARHTASKVLLLYYA